MENKIYKPLFDKMYWIILIATGTLLLISTVLAAFAPLMLLLMLPLDLFTVYFLVTPLFGYVELRESSLYIRFGLVLKKEIPYENIRGVSKENNSYSASMISLKNSLEHLDVRYNSFDVVTVSVVGNDELMREIEARITK